MLQKIIESLVDQNETLWLELKSKWYWSDLKPQGKDWGELLKDFSALFNSYISPEEKEHKKYLIIGVDEVNKKYQDFDVNSRKEKISDLEDLEKLKKAIISKLKRNFVSTPEFRGSNELVDIETFFDITSLTVKENRLLIFVFHAAPYLLEVKKLLDGNETFRRGSIIIRKIKQDGTPENDNASHEEIEVLKEIVKSKQEAIYPDRDTSIKKTVEAFKDKIAPSAEMLNLASEKSSSGIYFEIFRVQGDFFRTTNFVYFSKYTTQNKTISHIVENHLLDKEIFNIVPTDKFNKSRGLIDKTRIKQLFQDHQVPVDVDYLEDFALNKLYGDLFDPQIFHQGNFNISDFVKPYTSSSNDKTVDILLSEWYESPRKPLVVIKGMGGIGKTTVIKHFLDELYNQSQNVYILFINSHEIINDIMKSPKVESIYDFYKIVAEKIDDIKKIDEKLFELSIDNGNLVIALDGIDEVIAKVGNKFNTGIFIDSIFQNYSENLEKAKILITCRDYFWDDSSKSNYPIERIVLEPFSEKLAETYFRYHFTDENKVKKAMSLANDFAQSSDESLFFEKKEKIYIPYILDMIKEDLMSREDLLSKSSPQKIQTKILQAAKDTNDYLIGKVCEREIVKLENLPIDNQIHFLVHIAFSYNGIVHQKQMPKIEATLKNRGVTNNQLEKFKGHPLLIFDKGRETLEFRFDFFNEYFKVIGLSVFFMEGDLAKNISTDIVDTITQYVSYENSFTKALQKRLRNIDSDFYMSIWDFLTGKIDDVIEDLDRKKQLNSSLFILLILLKNASDIEARTALLKEVYEHKNGIIRNLCIINLHPIKGRGKITFDFRELRFEKCFFENYEHFSACRFDDKTYFVETKFVAPLHTQGVKSQIISANIDKSSCDIAGIIDVIDEVERVYESKDLTLRQDLKQVIKFFWQGSSFRQKLASEANKKLRAYSNIMEILIKQKVIQVTTVTTKQKRADKAYFIDPSYSNLRKIMEENDTCLEFEKIVNLFQDDI